MSSATEHMSRNLYKLKQPWREQNQGLVLFQQVQAPVFPKASNKLPSSKCHPPKLTAKADWNSFDRLASDTDVVGYPILGLVRQLTEATPEDVAKYIHWGATTQDIMDNASVLQMRQGIRLIRGQILELIAILQDLAIKYRDT